MPGAWPSYVNNVSRHAERRPQTRGGLTKLAYGRHSVAIASSQKLQQRPPAAPMSIIQATPACSLPPDPC
ncbi:hypothetical protein A7C99_6285 [Trichophyton rubrum]|uniref:Uncharacterized protein n=1 Tax=Trichophyton rubrum TaxID=5551 RepID=A0A178EQV0_TRIRU|nr:hypothetical protein A7C99_6285 [Trichophyton rubrum]